jgi:hypothetical protein
MNAPDADVGGDAQDIHYLRIWNMFPFLAVGVGITVDAPHVTNRFQKDSDVVSI